MAEPSRTASLREPADPPSGGGRTQLCDRAHLLREVLETSAAGLFTVDSDRRITTWNRGMEHLSGYSASEALGAPCSLLGEGSCFRGSEMGHVGCPLFAEEAVIGRHCTIQHRDGRRVAVLKHARLMRDPNGQVLGGIESVADMSGVEELSEEVDRLRQDAETAKCGAILVGDHPRMNVLRELITAAAQTQSSVLVLGETGTGKELVARSIHCQSSRSEWPFVRVSCGALSESVLESELFGHVRGAFTGAVRGRAGRFEAAHRGTIFLDEIGDISLNVQQKLVRVLQEHEFERVGDNRTVKVDIRVVAATNKDLPALIQQGRFRPDLYYRLAVIPIRVPPLRDRSSDITALAETFAQRLSRTHFGRMISGEAHELLSSYRWPGNVRELEHAIEYAFAVADGPLVRPEHLPRTIRGRRPHTVDSHQGAGLTRSAIVLALRETHGNRTQAAKRLGVSRVTLWKWMKRFSVE